MTVLGADRPGLVSSPVATVASHGGNWLESRMTRLAGQFAGVARIKCATDVADALIRKLQTPGDPGLSILAVCRILVVDVVGHDRPGIVRELSAAVVNAGGSIEELTTSLESVPMSGHPIFRAHGIVSIPETQKFPP